MAYGPNYISNHSSSQHVNKLTRQGLCYEQRKRKKMYQINNIQYQLVNFGGK